MLPTLFIIKEKELYYSDQIHKEFSDLSESRYETFLWKGWNFSLKGANRIHLREIVRAARSLGSLSLKLVWEGEPFGCFCREAWEEPLLPAESPSPHPGPPACSLGGVCPFSKGHICLEKDEITTCVSFRDGQRRASSDDLGPPSGGKKTPLSCVLNLA